MAEDYSPELSYQQLERDALVALHSIVTDNTAPAAARANASKELLGRLSNKAEEAPETGLIDPDEMTIEDISHPLVVQPLTLRHVP